MSAWGSDDDDDAQEGDNAAMATATTPITTSNNGDDSWAQEEPPDIQAQPMSANLFPRPSHSNTSGPLKGLEGFLSKALIRVFTLSMSNLRPEGCSPYFDKYYFKDSHIAGIGRDVAGDYYIIHRSGVRLFDKPWAKTWTPVSEEPINRLKRDQSAVYLTTDGPEHYYDNLRETLLSKRIISLSGNLYVPTSQGMHDYTRIQIELDDNLEISKQCTMCLKWETEWEMQHDGTRERLELKTEMMRFLSCRGCKKQVYCSKECHQAGWDAHSHKYSCLFTMLGEWSTAFTYWDEAPLATRPTANGANTAWGGAAPVSQDARAETPGGAQSMDWEPAGGGTTSELSATAVSSVWDDDTPAAAPVPAQNGNTQQDAEPWDSSPLPTASAPAISETAGIGTASASIATGPAVSASTSSLNDHAWASPIPLSGAAGARNSAAWGSDTPKVSDAGVTANASASAWGGDTPAPMASGMTASASTAHSAWDNDAPTTSTQEPAPTNSAWGSGSSPPHTSAPSSTQAWGDASSATDTSNGSGWGSSDAYQSFRGGRGGFRGGEGRGRGGFRGDFGGGGRGRGRGGDFVPKGTVDSDWRGFRGRGRGRARGNDGGQSFDGGHRGGWGGQNTSYNNSASVGSSNTDSWGAPASSSSTQGSTSDEWGSSSASSAPTSTASTASAPISDTWTSKVDEGVGLIGSKNDIWGDEVTPADNHTKTGADAWGD